MRTFLTTGSSWRPIVSSIVVKSMWRSSPGPLHGSFCSLAMGGAPSYFLQRAQFFTLLVISLVIPGHQNCSCMRERERCWPWWAASRWHPSNAMPWCDWGTIKHHRSLPVLVRWVLWYNKPFLSTYHIPPLFIGLCGLGIEDLTHGPHEILLRGPQILDQGVRAGSSLWAFFPVYHLKSCVLDWTGW